MKWTVTTPVLVIAPRSGTGIYIYHTGIIKLYTVPLVFSKQKLIVYNMERTLQDSIDLKSTLHRSPSFLRVASILASPNVTRFGVVHVASLYQTSALTRLRRAQSVNSLKRARNKLLLLQAQSSNGTMCQITTLLTISTPPS